MSQEAVLKGVLRAVGWAFPSELLAVLMASSLAEWPRILNGPLVPSFRWKHYGEACALREQLLHLAVHPDASLKGIEDAITRFKKKGGKINENDKADKRISKSQ